MKDNIIGFVFCLFVFMLITSPISLILYYSHANSLAEKRCIDIHNVDNFKLLDGVTYCNVGGYSKQDWIKLGE